MNKDIFDVLDNADDEMIERLSSFTDDNDEAKKRITEMSERKYQNLKAGISENEGKDKNEITMNVADKRPVRWYKPIAAAVAVFAVVAGVTKVTSELEKYKAPSDDVLPAAQTETTSPAQSESVTEQQSALTEDQMKELTDRFCDFYYDLFDSLVIRQYTVDNEGHYVIKNPDNYVDVQDKDHYEINNFYEFSDARFNTLDEFNDYYSCFFDGTGIKFNAGKKYDKLDGEKLLFADETIDEYYRNGWLDDMLFECDNKLYLNEDIVRDYHYGPSHIREYFSERSFYVTENSFTRIRLFKDDNCRNPYGQPMIYGLSVTFNKDEDGMWSIGKVSSPNSYVSDYVELFGDFSEISDTNCYQMLFDVYPYPNDLPYVSKPWYDDSQPTEVFTTFAEEKPFEEEITSIGIETDPAPFTTIEIKNNTQSYSEDPDNTNDIRNYLFFDFGLEPASPSVSTEPDYVSYGNSKQE